MRSFLQLSCLLGLAAHATAQAIASNYSSYNGDNANGLPLMTGGATPVVLVPCMLSDRQNCQTINAIPLTTEAYTVLPHGRSDQGYRNGSAVLATPGKGSVDSFHTWDVAVVSCDSSDYTNSNIGLSDVITSVVAANVSSIVFYTEKLKSCNMTDSTAYGNYPYLYSIVNTQDDGADSKVFVGELQADFAQNTAHLYSYTAFKNVQNAQAQGNLFNLGGSGSTAVAMIILYSITGVITALFLLIIVTGAIRAHRHPERYGPRNIIGRPRQSRAKGIARAMLDTIPIVKFGGEDAQPKDADSDTRQASQSVELASRDIEAGPNQETTETAALASGIGAAAATRETHASNPNSSSQTDPQNEDNSLGCSICTEDFELGQDIRVLPCNHQFHPACVDPWLLDVSGTCPLCRVDLNPQAGATASDELPPPLDPDNNARSGAGRGRATLRAIFFRRAHAPDEMSAGLQSANPAERLAALRRWRRSPEGEAARAEAAEITSSGVVAADARAEEAEAGAAGVQNEEERRSRLGRLSRLVRRR